MTGSGRAAVWVLLGPHKGDNNQVLALAEALGLPFRALTLKYKPLAHLPAVCRIASISQLADACRLEIVPPWPSLVLGIGQRSAPVARYIQQASGGRTKTVRLGDPMVSHRLFDLVITTTQYAVRDADNVVRLPITITNEDAVHPNGLEAQWLDEFAKPRRLLVIGGKTSLWRFDEQVVVDALRTLERRAQREGGSVLAVASPRTSRELVAAAEAILGQQAVVTGNFPRYGALLNGADEIHVTGDSVSMLSDAVTSGKPVGLIPLEPTRVANFLKWAGKVRGRRFRMRDLEKFWDDLRARGLVGTIDAPRSGTLDISPMEIAVAAVNATLEGKIPEAHVMRRGKPRNSGRSAAAEPAL
ncbi:MAG TPA: ELM1/GtrOC1 family putative glycosyltransferase [Sphingomicrobium sp.]|nr:ELM1/GtrOC1 family putative glycosyltransferase [Sphingomicrobium sp.]